MILVLNIEFWIIFKDYHQNFINFSDRYEASPLEFPHQALLGYQINEEVMWICGGSLISPEFVLTGEFILFDPIFHHH